MKLMDQRRPGRTGKGRSSRAPLPRAHPDVLATDLGDEVVVYDSRDHRGHCLNASAAMVWRHLDGQTSLDEMVARLRRDLDASADEDTVWLALVELDRARLLAEPLEKPAPRDVSRRNMLRRMAVAAGGGAVLVPAISSIVAPPVHAQASALGCATPDVSCATFSCGGGCACASTTEGTNVCVVPDCGTLIACATSAGCPPGMVCFTMGCCGQGNFCVPIAPPNTSCFTLTSGGSAWQGR
jgi:hypothetical protein